MDLTLTRRELLKKIGLGGLVLVGGHIVKSSLSLTQLGHASDAKKWKQFAGSKIVFMSEDTTPTLAIEAKIKPFLDLTGIDIVIISEHLDVISEKVGIDVMGKKGAYACWYAQDKPIGATFCKHAVDLRTFEKDPSMPKVRDGQGHDVWLHRFLDVTGSFFGDPEIVAYPYDNAVAVMFYRKDLFEKYSPKFESEYGKPLVYNRDTTWKDVLEICKFFKRMKFPDAKYGIALQGREGWSGQLCYQRISYSNGMWLEWDFDDYVGTEHPGPCKWGDEQSVMSMTNYKELMKYAHPDSLTNDWSSANTAYMAGLGVMMPEYGEYCAVVEDPSQSLAAGGRTAYELCPKGDPAWIVGNGKAVNGTNAGIGGIAINRWAKKDLQKAAYLFAIWCTSHDTQYMVLHDVGGTPTRKSVFELQDVKMGFDRKTAPMKKLAKPVEMEKGVIVTEVPLMPNGLTYGPILEAIHKPMFVVGPKVVKFNEYIQIQTSEIHKSVAGIKTPREACESIKKKTDRLYRV